MSWTHVILVPGARKGGCELRAICHFRGIRWIRWIVPGRPDVDGFSYGFCNFSRKMTSSFEGFPKPESFGEQQLGTKGLKNLVFDVWQRIRPGRFFTILGVRIGGKLTPCAGCGDQIVMLQKCNCGPRAQDGQLLCLKMLQPMLPWNGKFSNH